MTTFKVWKQRIKGQSAGGLSSSHIEGIGKGEKKRRQEVEAVARGQGIRKRRVMEARKKLVEGIKV